MKKVLLLLTFMLSAAFTVYAAEDQEVEISINPEDYQQVQFQPLAAVFGDFDYQAGYFDINNINGGLATDNNLSTYVSLTNPIRIDLDKSIDIKAFFIQARHGWNSGMNVIFYNEKNEVLLNKPLTAGQYINTNYFLVNLTNVKYVVVTSQTPTLGHLDEFDVFEDAKVYESISNLSVVAQIKSADLTWENPVDSELQKIKITLDGKVVYDGSVVNKFELKDLVKNKNYYLKIDAIYKNGVTIKHETEFKTLNDAGEVTKLTAEATHERVDLSWTLPQNAAFKHVNIYRDKKTSFFSSLGMETAYAASKKIFETNGTYFNDLTVEEDTKYEYTITTESIDKFESEGVSIEVKTAKAPPVDQIGGDGWEKDPNGDYLYKWTSPTKGKVKVLVGGKEFKIVQASDLQVTIPAAQMKFTLFGKPDVVLIPISEDGNEGKPVKPPVVGGGGNGGNGGGTGGTGDIELPFSLLDLIKVAFDLLKLFGPYILLGLGLILMPRIVKIFKGFYTKNKGGN